MLPQDVRMKVSYIFIFNDNTGFSDCSFQQQNQWWEQGGTQKVISDTKVI